MLRNRNLISLLVLVALLLTAACQPITAQSQPMTPPSDEDAVAAIQALWEEYSASALAGDPTRRMALWAEDGIQMPPDRAARVGKETIQAATEAGMARVVANEYVVSPEEIEIMGDFAFARGVYHANRTPVAGGDPIVTDGKFMTILKRQEDGSWQIYRDIFNSNVPPAPVAAEETDVEAVTASILTTWDEYVASTLTNNVDRRLALWADDGVILRPGRPPFDGKEAIYERVQGSFSRTTYEEMTIDNLEVEVSGDMAFARGTYTVKGFVTETGAPIVADGTYMSIFKRQADGTWKLYRDMTHSNIPPTPPTDVNEVADAVDAIWREYEASLLDGDVERWIAQWMDNGVQMPPNMPPRVGKETIYTAVSGFLSNFEYTDFVIENEDVEVNGDLAFARGTYQATFVSKDGGDPVTVEGKYMTILRQQEDGSWKLYRDIFNSNVP